MAEKKELDQDSWRTYQSKGVAGCEKMDKATLSAIEKLKEVEKQCELVQKATEKGDLVTAQEHFKKMQELGEEVKAQCDKADKERERLQKINESIDLGNT